MYVFSKRKLNQIVYLWSRFFFFTIAACGFCVLILTELEICHVLHNNNLFRCLVIRPQGKMEFMSSKHYSVYVILRKGHLLISIAHCHFIVIKLPSFEHVKYFFLLKFRIFCFPLFRLADILHFIIIWKNHSCSREISNLPWYFLPPFFRAWVCQNHLEGILPKLILDAKNLISSRGELCYLEWH